MRISIIITGITFFLLSYLSCQSSKTSSENNEQLITVSIDVKGMTCEGCETAIVKNLDKLEGVEEATASHTDSVALVTFDKSLVSVDELKNSIEQTGYTVTGHKLKDNL